MPSESVSAYSRKDYELVSSRVKDIPAAERKRAFFLFHPFTRHKGFLSCALRGVTAIDKRKDGDTSLLAGDQNVPFTNYGIFIAYMQGILKRSLGIFPELQKQIK